MSFTIQIKKLTNNRLLSRRQMHLTIKHPNSPTPTKEEITKQLSFLYQSEPKNIVVEGCSTKFGTHETEATAKVYKDFEAFENVERAFVVARKTGVKERKVVRRQRKDARKKRSKMWGSMRRNVRKAEKKNK